MSEKIEISGDADIIGTIAEIVAWEDLKRRPIPYLLTFRGRINKLIKEKQKINNKR